MQIVVESFRIAATFGTFQNALFELTYLYFSLKNLRKSTVVNTRLLNLSTSARFMCKMIFSCVMGDAM